MMKSRPSGAMVACLFNFLSIPSEGGSMNRLIIWSAVLLMTAVFRAEASIEYLRFEAKSVHSTTRRMMDMIQLSD